MENQSPTKNDNPLLEESAQATQKLLELLKQDVLEDFWSFSKEVVGWKDLYEPLHKPLCDFVQETTHKKKLVLLPRGHLKSSVVTIGYALWKIAQDPKNRILIANGTYPLAATFLSQIKDHILRNAKFKQLFGDLFVSADKWSESAITVKREESYERKEPTVTAFGIGGNLVSQHYDIIILDDLVNRENIHTPDRIQDVLTFYKDILDLLEPGGTIIMIGTRWHEADLYGWILDDQNPEHYEYDIMLKTAVEGEYEIVKNADTGGFHIQGGEILFPTKFSREHLDKLLNKGLSEFSSQYMNDPVPLEDSVFKWDWKYYEDDDLRGMEVRHFITCDPAFFDPSSKTVDLDYTAFVVIAVDADNNWWIRDIVRERMKPNEIIETIFNLDAFWKPTRVGIETTAYQKILSHMIKDKMREKNQFIPITELKHAGSHAKSKAERIQALEPRYAVGSILHSKTCRHMTTLELELRRFPRAKTDDVADALASMFEIALPPARHDSRSTSKMPSYPA
jgi:predicted phage terminase large subunit-like protein